MRKSFSVFILIFMILLFSFPEVALAHRSGCHRWHSCPSDSGSYVCGDTGHNNYCGNAPASTPTPTPMPLTPIPSPSPTPTPIAIATNIPPNELMDTGNVNATSLNVRSGPGLSYPVVSTLTEGVLVIIVEQQNDWFHIQLPGVSSAWVSASYVSKVGNSTAATASVATNANSIPVLISPIDGQVTHDPIIFTWTWAKPLGSDEGFDVQVWKDDESPAGVAHPSFVVSQGNGTYTLHVSSLTQPKANTYFWRVRVINVKTGAEIAPSAQPASFRYE